MLQVINVLQNAINSNQSIASVTIIKEQGSSPRGIGSMMLVNEDGLVEGSIGGGAVELKAIADAQVALLDGHSKTVSYPLASLDMTCGGDIEVFIQVYVQKDEILIIGAGHICEELTYYLKPLPYKVTVLDHRDEFAIASRFPECTVICNTVVEGLNSIKFHKKTNVIIVTHGHEYDEVALRYVLKQPYKYVGMIGSQTKISKCFNAMIVDGYSKEQLASVYAPIGLTLGGETPAEIALSIVSEIQSINNKKNAIHLRDVNQMTIK
ncbi:MAG: XdhC family protein [Clostridiales bacterium]|nr:XdhC family protein [Clostridiales bacterium]